MGTTPDLDAAVTDPDADVSDPDARVLPEDGGEITSVGWRSEAFEHSGFVPRQNVDPAQLETCSPYLMASAGQETWWTNGTAYEDLLSLFPYPDGGERLSLIEATGLLSEPGQFGHMDGYEREFLISSYQVRACDTVEAVGHCVVPREADFCQFPEPEVYEERVFHTVQEIGGPAGGPLTYHVSVTYNPNVADGTTGFSASFTLPPDLAPDGPQWEVFEVGDGELQDLQLLETRLWFYFEEIPYPYERSGWVLRNRTDGGLRISLFGAGEEGAGTLHLWGDFPIDEIIGYP